MLASNVSNFMSQTDFSIYSPADAIRTLVQRLKDIIYATIYNEKFT